MIGVPAMPGSEIPVEVAVKMVTVIRKVSGISQIIYDLTSKPPELSGKNNFLVLFKENSTGYRSPVESCWLLHCGGNRRCRFPCF